MSEQNRTIWRTDLEPIAALLNNWRAPGCDELDSDVRAFVDTRSGASLSSVDASSSAKRRECVAWLGMQLRAKLRDSPKEVFVGIGIERELLIPLERVHGLSRARTLAGWREVCGFLNHLDPSVPDRIKLCAFCGRFFVSTNRPERDRYCHPACQQATWLLKQWSDEVASELAKDAETQSSRNLNRDGYYGALGREFLRALLVDSRKKFDFDRDIGDPLGFFRVWRRVLRPRRPRYLSQVQRSRGNPRPTAPTNALRARIFLCPRCGTLSYRSDLRTKFCSPVCREALWNGIRRYQRRVSIPPSLPSSPGT